jgi:hypothetical protein
MENSGSGSGGNPSLSVTDPDGASGAIVDAASYGGAFGATIYGAIVDATTSGAIVDTAKKQRDC